MSSVGLRLTRRWSFYVRDPYEVLVDDRRIGAVRNREMREFSVTPGGHTLQLRAGRFSSATRSFEAYDGAAAAFSCRGVRLWPAYLVALFKPDLAILLWRG